MRQNVFGLSKALVVMRMKRESWRCERKKLEKYKFIIDYFGKEDNLSKMAQKLLAY